VTLVVYAMNMVFLGWGPLEAERLGRVFVSGGPVAALVIPFGPYGACTGIRGLGSITITKDDTFT
jgi:hypothetical protein